MAAFVMSLILLLAFTSYIFNNTGGTTTPIAPGTTTILGIGTTTGTGIDSGTGTGTGTNTGINNPAFGLGPSGNGGFNPDGSGSVTLHQNKVLFTIAFLLTDSLVACLRVKSKV